MKDMVINKLDVFRWLKTKYGLELNAQIVSVLFCQDNDDVWLEIIKRNETEIGILEQREMIDLNFICDVEDDDHIEMPVFTTKRSLIDNAKLFFEDKITLLNTTSLFDK